VANLNADKVDGQDADAFLGANQKATDADMLDGKNSSDFQPSNPCPSGTLFHEGACIETAKRATAGFPNAEATCLNAGRRLPTVAELQTFRLQEGHDFNTAEYTSHIWSDTNGSTQTQKVMLVDPATGAQSAATASSAFRCVAEQPNVATTPNDAWEFEAQRDLRNAAATATLCYNNSGPPQTYVVCDTIAELEPYGFNLSADIIVNGINGSWSDWSAAMQHANGGSAFTYATFGPNAGQVVEAPRGTSAPPLP
jgi:hypothetical protein